MNLSYDRFNAFLQRWWRDEEDTVNEVNKRFWMVKRDGYGSASTQHASKHSAVREAQRLAQENPGVYFFVLETIGVARVVQPAQYIEWVYDPPF